MLKIDPEFKSLIPNLSTEEYQQLEKNILSEGIREPIILWNEIIIDGHNRYEIATKYNLDYKTVNKDFPSRKNAIEWMILNQFGRRNLSNYDRSLLALRLKPMFEERAKENQIRTSENRVRQISDKQEIDTKKEIAKLAGVSHDTIAKVQKIEDKATPETPKSLIL